MLKRKYGRKYGKTGHSFVRLLSTRALTGAIIASVVLVNTVAWGIPLLSGRDHRAELVAGSNIKTASLPRPTAPASSLAETLPSHPPGSAPTRSHLPPAPVAKSAIWSMPLPSQGPIMAQPVSTSAVPRFAFVTSDAPIALLIPSEQAPATLYPRPETPPRNLFLNETAPPSSVVPAKAQPASAPARPREAEIGPREIVLVSPYTPGVRTAPNGHGREWRHRNLRASQGATTLDTAKAIAKRAAEQFEQMRDRMAKLDAQSADLSESERARSRALLPVAPQPPRVVDSGIGRSLAKSAYSFVRPRLVRRPIGGSVIASAYNPSVAPEAASPSTETSAVQRAQRPAQGEPTKVERQMKRQRALARANAVRIDLKRANLRKANLRRAALKRRYNLNAKRKRLAVAREKRRSAQRRAFRVGAARARVTKRRRYSSRRGRKIDGFRRSFHRQLVASNFFIPNN